MKLKPKIKKVICSLGVGEHFEHWDFERDMIIEGDWNDLVLSENGFKVYTVPARHFSGRLQRNKSLWTAFVLETPLYKIFIGGDGGYDTHFAEIGKTFREFDLVLLDNGQHNKYWKYIHMMPDEVLQAGKDLNAKRLLPGHSGKFAIANHAWDEPLKQITELNKDFNLNLITPIIGEPVILKNTSQKFSRWWELIR
jgi:L-ascorbate metabolism protein UlaG (beta-lactamase superfamily)